MNGGVLIGHSRNSVFGNRNILQIRSYSKVEVNLLVFEDFLTTRCLFESVFEEQLYENDSVPSRKITIASTLCTS